MNGLAHVWLGLQLKGMELDTVVSDKARPYVYAELTHFVKILVLQQPAILPKSDPHISLRSALTQICNLQQLSNPNPSSSILPMTLDHHAVYLRPSSSSRSSAKRKKTVLNRIIAEWVHIMFTDMLTKGARIERVGERVGTSHLWDVSRIGGLITVSMPRPMVEKVKGWEEVEAVTTPTLQTIRFPILSESHLSSPLNRRAPAGSGAGLFEAPQAKPQPPQAVAINLEEAMIDLFAPDPTRGLSARDVYLQLKEEYERAVERNGGTSNTLIYVLDFTIPLNHHMFANPDGTNRANQLRSFFHLDVNGSWLPTDSSPHSSTSNPDSFNEEDLGTFDFGFDTSLSTSFNHGYATALVAAGNVGLAHKSLIHSIRVLAYDPVRRQHLGDYIAVYKALEFVYEDFVGRVKAGNPRARAVVNMSMGVPISKEALRGYGVSGEGGEAAFWAVVRGFDEIVAKLLEVGVVIVNAAGNQNPEKPLRVNYDSGPSPTDPNASSQQWLFPQYHSSCLSIGAAAKYGDGEYHMASFSGFGGRVDAFAPGANIVVPHPILKGEQLTLWGTSDHSLYSHI
ncbi:hypothetical protein HK102_004080 [Quaeritorhiza haematococci]|nr:hypothetical protein HK102_004080 [Quaeritorhiza haematococci]